MASILDPMFAAPFPLPFPAGTSPFRQKGNGYVADLDYFDKIVPGGRAAVIAAMPDAALRTFCQQPFRTSEWYDAYPCTALHASAARLRGISFAEQRKQVGAYIAKTTGGLYRALLNVVSNENIAVWGPRVSTIFFEFGKTETKTVGEKFVRGMRRGVPAGLVQFVMFASMGFTEETLLLAGARTVSFVIGAVTQEDRAYGQELYTTELSIQWT